MLLFFYKHPNKIYINIYNEMYIKKTSMVFLSNIELMHIKTQTRTQSPSMKSYQFLMQLQLLWFLQPAAV